MKMMSSGWRTQDSDTDKKFKTPPLVKLSLRQSQGNDFPCFKSLGFCFCWVHSFSLNLSSQISKVSPFPWIIGIIYYQNNYCRYFNALRFKHILQWGWMIFISPWLHFTTINENRETSGKKVLKSPVGLRHQWLFCSSKSGWIRSLFCLFPLAWIFPWKASERSWAGWKQRISGLRSRLVGHLRK